MKHTGINRAHCSIKRDGDVGAGTDIVPVIGRDTMGVTAIIKLCGGKK